LSLAESAFSRSLESGGRFCVGAFCRDLASVAVKIFSRLIYFVRKVYKRTFNTNCKDNAVINCITFQQKKVSYPSTLTGHTLLLVKS
jgi:hypothetical protein